MGWQHRVLAHLAVRCSADSEETLKFSVTDGLALRSLTVTVPKLKFGAIDMG
jgi:hypothetical protein